MIAPMTARPMAVLAALLILIAGSLIADPLNAEETRTHGLSAFGTLKYGPDFTHFDYVNPDAPKGGSLSLTPDRGRANFDSLNAFILGGVPPQGIDESEPRGMRVYDSLMVRAYDEPDAVYGLIAESASVAPDRTAVTFTMRPEARWHDGTPITAKDVVFTFNTLKEIGHPRYAISLRDVMSAEALDDHTVTFTFDPDGALRDLPMEVALLPILSSAYYETHDFEAPTLDPPLTSGPYTFGRIDAPRAITYERVDDYWAKDLPVNKGRFNFDQVRFEFFRERAIGLEAFLAGDYDLREEFTSKSWATEYTGRAIDAGWIVRDTLDDQRPSGTQAFFLNTRRDKLSDPRVRKALDLIFDFEWTNRAIFYGAYQRTKSMFENSELAATGLPGATELELLEPWRDSLPPAVFGEAYVPPRTDGSGDNRANLRQAMQLLNEAGWRLKGGVLVNAAGEPFTLEFLTFQEGFNRIILPYIEGLKRLGIQATLRQVDAAQYQRRMEDFDFDATTARLSMPLTPGVEQQNLWSSAAANIIGSNNLSGVSHPAVDALIEAIKNAEDRPALLAATRALDRVLMHNHYAVPQWYKASHTIAYWDKFGRPDVKPPYGRGIIDLWWVDEDKTAALNTARDQGS